MNGNVLGNVIRSKYVRYCVVKDVRKRNPPVDPFNICIDAYQTSHHLNRNVLGNGIQRKWVRNSVK